MMRSRRACEVIGCTYRQLDYLTRSGAVRGMNGGSGTRRLWSGDQIVRLVLANHLMGAVPISNDYTSPFPVVAAATLAAPGPVPRTGYAVLTPDPLTVVWATDWADLRNAIDAEGAALIAAYDLAELVGDEVDLDDVTAAA